MAERPELIKMICQECKRSITTCLCPGPVKNRAAIVRVFTEEEVSEVERRLDAGEPLAALSLLRELLRGSTTERRRVSHRL